MTLPHGKVKGSLFQRESFEDRYLFILTRQVVPEQQNSGKFCCILHCCCLKGRWSFSLNDMDSEALKTVLHRDVRQQSDWCLSWGLCLSQDFLLIIIIRQDAYAKSRELNTLKYVSEGQANARFIQLSIPKPAFLSMLAEPNILMII